MKTFIKREILTVNLLTWFAFFLFVLPGWADAVSVEGDFFAGNEQTLEIKRIPTVIQYGRFHLGMSLEYRPVLADTSQIKVDELGIRITAGPRVWTQKTTYGALNLLKLFPEVEESGFGQTVIRLDSIEVFQGSKLVWAPQHNKNLMGNFKQTNGKVEETANVDLPIMKQVRQDPSTEIRLHFTVLENSEMNSMPLRELGEDAKMTIRWRPWAKEGMGLLERSPQMSPVPNPRPDLVLIESSIEASPPLPLPGTWFKISAVVTNQGSETSAATQVVLLLPNGDSEQTFLRPLGPMEYEPIRWNVRLSSPKKAFYQLVLDSNNHIEEENEANNISTLEVEPYLDTDMAFAAEPSFSGSAYAGETIFVTANIINQGYASAENTFLDIVVMIDKQLIDFIRTPIPTLEPGETTQITQPVFLPSPGSAKIALFLIAEGANTRKTELNSENNEAYFDIEVKERPIPEITCFKFYHYSYLATLEGTIRNGSDIEGRFAVSISCDDKVVHEEELLVPPGRQQTAVTKFFPAGYGLHRLEMKVVSLSKDWSSETVGLVRMEDIPRFKLFPAFQPGEGEKVFYPAAVETNGFILNENLYFLEDGKEQEITWSYDLRDLSEENVDGDTLKLVLDPALLDYEKVRALVLHINGSEEMVYEELRAFPALPITIDIPKRIWQGTDELVVSSIKGKEGWQVWDFQELVLMIPCKKSLDIEFSDVEIQPKRPYFGDTVTLSYGVKSANLMGQVIPVILTVKVNGEERQSFQTTLSPRTEKRFKLQVSSKKEDGPYLNVSFRVEAKEGWTIRKGDSATYSFAIYDPQPAELSMSEIFFSDEGEAIYSVTNHGPGSAYHFQTVWADKGDVLMGTIVKREELPPIEPGQTRWIKEDLSGVSYESIKKMAIRDVMRTKYFSSWAISKKWNFESNYIYFIKQTKAFRTTDGKILIAFAIQNNEKDGRHNLPVMLLQDEVEADSLVISWIAKEEITIGAFVVPDDLKQPTTFEIYIHPKTLFRDEGLTGNPSRIILTPDDSLETTSSLWRGEIHPWELAGLDRSDSPPLRLSKMYDRVEFHESWKALKESHQLGRITDSLRKINYQWGTSDPDERRVLKRNLEKFAEAQWDFARALDQCVLPVGTKGEEVTQFQHEARYFLRFMNSSLVLDEEETAERLTRVADLAEKVLLGTPW